MTSERLAALIEASGYDTFSDGYSGRAMYGRRCVAYQVPRDRSVLASVAEIVGQVEDQDDRDELIEVFADVRQDNLGLDTVVYFPSVAHEEVNA